MTKFSLASRRRPSWYASDLRKELGVDDQQPINLDQLSKFLDIRVKIASLRPNILGACKVVGLNKLIAISDKVTHPEQKRFLLSHEIGHAVVHNGIHNCRANDLKMWLSVKDKEKEANQFAAQLLLPEDIVYHKLRTQDVSFELAEELSHIYGISLTSCIIRLLEMSDENAVLFYQKGDSIIWSYFASECRIQAKTGKVDLDSLSYHTSITRPHLKNYVDPGIWFLGEFDDDVKCYEQTKYFHNFDSKLSIVRIDE